MDRKREVLEKLRTSAQVYVLLARTTNLPYVECDPETFDDQILLFFQEEDARRAAGRLLEEKIPVQIVKVEKKSFLSFYTSLYPMGVNGIVTGDGTPQRTVVQLDELIRRTDPAKLPKGQVWVENPQFHLTAIYFVQKLRGNPGQAMDEEMKALYEEMLVHFGRGKYIFAMRQDQAIPTLKGDDGGIYQPLFTDAQAFQRFSRGEKLQAMVVEAGKIPQFLNAKSSGVVINPMGVNIQLKVAKQAPVE